jgi:hypothetical protein
MKTKLLITALAAACVLIVSCGAMFTPPMGREANGRNSIIDSAGAINENALTQVAVQSVTACCYRGDDYRPEYVIDNDLTTQWAADNPDKSDPSYHAHGTGHYLKLDLGQVYRNITRVEYVPNFLYGSQISGSGYWISDPHWFGGVNNGICREFEIYVTDEPVLEGQEPPASALAGKGEWRNFEIYSNVNYLEQGSTGSMSQSEMETLEKQKFIATFNSVTGRYLFFRFVSTHSNHWNGYPRIQIVANAKELKVFTSEEPLGIDFSGLKKLAAKANAFRAAYLPDYGYTNAILNKWCGAVESYEANGGATWEMVKYLTENLQAYVDLAPRRMSSQTYDRIVPKTFWADDKGNHLQAHGGGVFYDEFNTGKWWFYGEDRTNNGGGLAGIHGYSSEDLYNWKDEGVVLPVFNNTVYNTVGGVKDFWDGSVAEDESHVEGLLYKINRWRKALGDWNADGVIEPNEQPYRMPEDLKNQIIGREVLWWNGVGSPPSNGSTGYFTDEYTLVQSGHWPTPAEAWDEIKEYIPGGNPNLFIEDSKNALPTMGSLGLTASRIAQFNGLYKHEAAWRRKQLYRFFNYQSIPERPKVIYQKDPDKQYTYDDRKFPYVMTIHIEGGSYDSSYGTAKAAIAVAQNPQGPFKLLWGYRVHFVENYHNGDNGGDSDPGWSKGMSRDQGFFLDPTTNTAYQFGSTEENRIMSINKMTENFAAFEGIPRFAAGGNQQEMLTEGYQNYLGQNFNLVQGSQREAPAPFIHFTADGMTTDSDGTSVAAAETNYAVSLGPVWNQSSRYYFCITSGSTGWFPNAQGKYRSNTGGAPIMGSPGTHLWLGRNKSSTMGSNSGSTDLDSNQNNGWNGHQGDPGSGSPYGNSSSLLFGYTVDGSMVHRGYDGQTTNVFQLRYPEHPWGIIGYRDDGNEPADALPDREQYPVPREFYEALKAMKGKTGYTKPLYGEQPDMFEPRAGKLVYGKYVYLLDSWDQFKNYDARYIWLPLRALTSLSTGNGIKARWMEQWRWQDFVYELGPFENCMIQDPSGADIWNDTGEPGVADIPALEDYSRMLGDISEYHLNMGKQNPGLYDGYTYNN